MQVTIKDVTKTIEVGGGVAIAVSGTRYTVMGEVLELAESSQELKVKGKGFEGWIPLAQVQNVLPPGDFALDNAINTFTEG